MQAKQSTATIAELTKSATTARAEADRLGREAKEARDKAERYAPREREREPVSAATFVAQAPIGQNLILHKSD